MVSPQKMLSPNPPVPTHMTFLSRRVLAKMIELRWVKVGSRPVHLCPSRKRKADTETGVRRGKMTGREREETGDPCPRGQEKPGELLGADSPPEPRGDAALPIP